MEQNELFRRYIWLVDLIYQNDGITRDEINRSWRISNLNLNHESEIPERTFHPHKNAIRHLFDIEIICNRSGDKSYSIAQREDIKNDKIKSWMIESFAVNALLNESANLKDRILFEPTPSGQSYLTPLLEAMRDNVMVELQYQSFHMDAPTPHLIEPYSMKIYRQRWYVLARRVDTDKMRTFALDRIKGLTRTDRQFTIPKGFNAEEYFSDSIGIIVEEDVPPQTVCIKVTGGQQNYIRSLPLHHSQQEIECSEHESIFKYYLKPSYDLIQELMRFGENVTVISPKWFRERVSQIIEKMSLNYNT